MITLRLIAIDLDDVAYVSIEEEIKGVNKDEMIDQLMESGSKQPDFICIKTSMGMVSLPKVRLKSLEFFIDDQCIKSNT